jgi:hypothetical protein
MPEAMEPLSLQALKLSGLPGIFLTPDTQHLTTKNGQETKVRT